jgi:uncharacterized LabA/DUF88 family protein
LTGCQDFVSLPKLSMSDQTYVFIDGAYLERVHREVMRAFFGVDGELDIFPISREARSSRVYFYDSVDYAQSANESEKDWHSRVLRLESALDQIRSLPGFFVRNGTVPGRDRGKRREQKEIDVMLGVDMVKHALKGNIKRAVLISGDLDLRPAVEALVEEGVAVEVWYHASSFAQGLPAAADRGVELRFRNLYEWNAAAFKETHRVPMVQSPGGGTAGKLLRAGKIRDWGWGAQLYRLETPQQVTQFSLWIDIAVGRTIRVYDRDENLVQRYVTVQYGPIDWEFLGEEVRIGKGSGA